MTSARQLEEKVASTRHEAEMYKGKALRWEEYHSARMSSRREVAAGDLVYEKGRRAVQLEQAARRAKLSAFVDHKTTEQRAAEGRHELRVAEEALRRFEEQLAEATRTLEAASQQAAAASAEADSRLGAVRAFAEKRLQEAEHIAEARTTSIDQAVIEETLRVDAVLRQEADKYQRQYVLREKASQRQRLKIEREVKGHEIAAEAAEGKRDRAYAEVQRRAERCNIAARAKVRMALDEQEKFAQSTLLRKNNMQFETGLRLEQAKARELAAAQELEARRARAEEALRLARQKEAAVEAECADAIRIQTEWVENLRQMLASKIAEWNATVLDAEAAAAQRVVAIQASAAEMHRTLDDEVRFRAAHVDEEVKHLEQMALNDRHVVATQLAVLESHTASVRQLSQQRVTEVQALSSSQKFRRQRLAEAAEAQCRERLAQTRAQLDGRCRQEAGLLMTYLESQGEEQATSPTVEFPLPDELQLWVMGTEGGAQEAGE